MKKKLYICPSVEFTIVSSYGVCQTVSIDFEIKGHIEEADPYDDGR